MTYPVFPKIPRLNRPVIVTEKIDGTNGQIYIKPLGDSTEEMPEPIDVLVKGGVGGPALTGIWAGSRNRWLSVGADNFGFAKWVEQNSTDLADILGEGTHFGEWWGPGIQRGYGLAEKRFSLFNTSRWSAEEFKNSEVVIPGLDVVPVLWESNFYDFDQEEVLNILRNRGSLASPGFMRPEGIVVFHTASNHLYKVTLVDDELSKREIIGSNTLKSEPINGLW